MGLYTVFRRSIVRSLLATVALPVASGFVCRDAAAQAAAEAEETEGSNESGDAAESDDADVAGSTRSSDGAGTGTRRPEPIEPDGTTRLTERATATPTAELPRAHRLEWDGGYIYGGLELDLAYATYSYPELELQPEETVHDLRGRFVVGPMLHHPFGDSGYYLRATGQLVAWLREKERLYQINVDDVYGQFGKEGLWDLQIGRFMTWRVYHKGLGFDLYTIEDNGASLDPPISNARFVVHAYEVDYIFLRNSPYVGGEVAGRAALHFYPLKVLGFELTGAYGLAQNEAANTLGGRLAADFHWEFLRLSAAGEYRVQTPTVPLRTRDTAGAIQECTDCSKTDNKGVGGGAIVNLSIVEVGGGVAKGWDRTFKALPGEGGEVELEPVGTGSRFSYGGYLQLDLGKPIFGRSLILGAGAHQTDWVLDNKDAQYHTQIAGYVAYPLGFNDAMIKLVISRSSADLYDATDVEGNNFILKERSSTAARFRLVYGF